MKVIPKTISNFVVTPGEKSVILGINESLEVEYLLTENSNNEVLQDLIEAKAYATALLYLNETYRLVTNSKLFKENKVEDYYNDCNELLKENVEIVEEKGIPLVSIKGYNIYESDLGILRGNGKKKLKECFNKKDLEESNTINIEDLAWDLVDFGENYDSYDFNDNYDSKEEAYEETLKSLSNKTQIQDIITFIKNVIEDNPDQDHEREESLIARLEQVIPTLNEEGEGGTQVGDIAPKVDQDMNGKTKKKYYDILLSGIDESMDMVLNKGFMKNIDGQYERDGYILIKENNKFIAVRKDKLLEGYEDKSGQMSIDEKGLPELPHPYSIQLRNDKRYQITSSHPYDNTDYSWAVSINNDINSNWKIMDSDNNMVDVVIGWDNALELLQKLDSTKTTHIDRT